LLIIVLQSSRVQTFLTQKAGEYLSEQLGVEVSVGYVNISLFSSLLLEEVYVEDQTADTLAFIEKVRFELSYYNITESEFHLDKIGFENPVFKLTADTAGVMNFQFLINYFASEEDTATTESKAMKLICKNFDIQNARLLYKVENAVENDSIMNFDDLEINNLYLNIANFETNEDSTFFDVTNFSFLEKSGFCVKNFHSSNYITDSDIKLLNFHFQLDTTSFYSKKIKLNFTDFDDFQNFTEKVSLDINIDSSTIGLSDFAYFSTFLYGLDSQIKFSGNFTGIVNNLSCKNLKLQYEEKTSLACDFNFTNLLNTDSSLLFFKDIYFYTTANEISNVPLPPFSEGETVDLPDIVNKFGTISYVGDFSLLRGHYLPNGLLNTALGSVMFDMEVEMDTLQNIDFAGQIDINEFEVGKLLDNEAIGKLSLSTVLTGKSTKEEPFSSHFETLQIEEVEYDSYNYKRIEISGDATSKSFFGKLNINDPNIVMSNTLLIDMTKELYDYNISSSLKYINLNEIGLDSAHTNSKLSYEMDAKFSGNNVDNIQGILDFPKFLYENEEGQVLDTYINLEMKNGENKFRSLDFDLGNFLHAEVEGNFSVDTIACALQNYAASLFPSVLNPSTDSINMETVNENVAFKFVLRNINPVTRIFMPDILFTPNTSFEGNYDTRNNKLNLLGTATETVLFGNRFNNFFFSAISQNNKLLFNIGSKQMFLSDSVTFDNIMVQADMYNDTLELGLKWNTWESNGLAYRGNISTSAILSKKDSSDIPIIDIEFSPSQIIIADTIWSIDESKISIDGSKISITDLHIENRPSYNPADSALQFLIVDGVISENKEDTISVFFHNIDIAHFNMVTQDMGVHLGGVLNGYAHATNLYKNPVLFTDDKIENLMFNNQSLGDFSMKSDWDSDSKKIHVQMYAVAHNDTTINIDGYYIPESGGLDFNKIGINKFPLITLNPYIKGIATIMEQRRISDSKLGAKMTLKGNIEKPELNGIVWFQRLLLNVDYLGTTYFFSDTFNIENNNIFLKDLRITTRPMGVAKINGAIKHTNFTNLNFDFTLEAYDFLFLDTEEKDADLYYGKVYANAFVNIKGNTDDVKINAFAKTMKNTSLNVLLNTASEANEMDFITFVSHDTLQLNEIEEEYKVDLSGLDLKFDLEVTPETELRIVFDEKTGEVITVRGAANLQIGVNRLGDMTMVGDYTIEQGAYPFTLGVITKNFRVEKGGSIRWNGDPMNANLNLNAIYSTKANVYDLTMEEIDKESNEPVDCFLKITGSLSSPNIEFDIQMPQSEERIRTRIAALTTDDKNKQFLMLLVVNRFMASSGMASSTSVDFNTGEMISQQLSRMLSQISNDFDIGIDYRPGDEITSNEIEVAFSTQLFNDKVSLNVGVTGGQDKMPPAGNPDAAGNAAIMGDFELEYKISNKLRVKAFNKANDNMVNDAPYTQGFGVFYRRDFTYFSELELFKRFGILRKKDEKVIPPEN